MNKDVNKSGKDMLEIVGLRYFIAVVFFIVKFATCELKFKNVSGCKPERTKDIIIKSPASKEITSFKFLENTND